MMTEIEELHKRIDDIEKQKNQEILTLVEILSNATFFGEIKKATCQFSKKGQCGFYVLELEAKNKIPIATDCRIENCTSSSLHCHLELSNMACALCQITNGNPTKNFSRGKSKKSKIITNPRTKRN